MNSDYELKFKFFCVNRGTVCYFKNLLKNLFEEQTKKFIKFLFQIFKCKHITSLNLNFFCLNRGTVCYFKNLLKNLFEEQTIKFIKFLFQIFKCKHIFAISIKTIYHDNFSYLFSSF